MCESATKTILLVEDEAVIALAGKKALERYGYSVLIVHSGEQAIEMVRTVPEIDLVLMDIDLGAGIDGTQAAERILEDHELPIIFVSSHNERKVVDKTEKITSYGYIVKSSSMTVFDASIKMAFKLYAKNQELLETRNKLKTTLDAIPDLMFIVDKQGTFVDYHNRPDVHNTAISSDKIIGSHLSDLFSPEETATQLALYRRCLDTGQVLTYCYELVPNGITRTFCAQLARLDSDHILAIVRDITKEKQTEEKLRQCEELLKAYQRGSGSAEDLR